MEITYITYTSQFVKAHLKTSLDFKGGKIDAITTWEEWHSHIAKTCTYQDKGSLWPLSNLPQWPFTEFKPETWVTPLIPSFAYIPYIQAITKYCFYLRNFSEIHLLTVIQFTNISVFRNNSLLGHPFNYQNLNGWLCHLPNCLRQKLLILNSLFFHSRNPSSHETQKHLQASSLNPIPLR